VIVRCGACGAQFEAPGEGRFGCPACGAQNEVRRRVGAEPQQQGPAGERPAAPFAAPLPPSRPPDPPTPRITCPGCEFRFIVGDVATAPCPNCGSMVAVDREES
jgi:DNA-directed RNA polymerase subunit RPC12/RpoP